MKIRNGFIPSEVLYVTTKEKQVRKNFFEAVEYTYAEIERINFNVTPVKVTLPDIEWKVNHVISDAKKTFQKWNTNKNAWDIFGEPESILVKNEPIRDLHLANFDTFGNKYYVVTPQGYYFPIKGDVLMESINSNGILPHGKISGEFVWAAINYDLQLIRKNSNLYNVLVDASERSMFSKISNKKLEPGKVYLNTYGERSVFLGFISTEEYWMCSNQLKGGNPKEMIVRAYKNSKKSLWFDVSMWSMYNTQILKDRDPNEITEEDYMEWFLSKALQKEEYLDSRFTIRRTHSMVCCPKSSQRINLPEDIIEIIRTKAVNSYNKDIQERISNLKKHIEITKQSPVSYYSLDACACEHSPMALMHKYKTPPIQPKEPGLQRLVSHLDKVLPDQPPYSF